MEMMKNAVMDPMLNAVSSGRNATQSGAKPKDGGADFGSMVQRKQQETRGAQDTRPAQATGPKKADAPATAAQDNDIPEEQYVVAAAMMMQSWLQMVPFNVTPEENTLDVEIAPAFLPDMHTETVLDIPVEEVAAQVQETLVEAPKDFRPQFVEQVRAQTVEVLDQPLTEEQSEETEETVVVEEASVETPVFGYIDAQPVKVASVVTQPVELEAPDALEQLKGRIEQFLTDAEGNNYVELTLSPPELGKITVSLTQLTDGALHIQLSATTVRAAELLERNTAGLQQLLASASRPEIKVEMRDTSAAAPYIFINPNEDNGQNQQRQQQGQQKKERERQEHEDRDFIHQLRLGLVGI